MKLSNTYRQNLGAYRHLSGARLETAKRVFRQDAIAGVSVGLAVSIAAVVGRVSNNIIALFVLGVLILWQIWRLSRRETYIQIRAAEIKASKQLADGARNDLEQYAESLKKKMDSQ